MIILDKLSSAAYNSIVGGLQGFEATKNINLAQLRDEICEQRLLTMKKYAVQNQLPLKDLYYTISCIKTDCKSLDRCCFSDNYSSPQLHFEIPQIFLDAKDSAILFLGSTDRQVKFKVYTEASQSKYHKYRTRGANKPYVYIDVTPNENNKLDCYIFNAPMLERVTISAIFKNLDDLDEYSCCNQSDDYYNLTWIDTEVKDAVVNKYVKFYRQLIQPTYPNDQTPK